MITLQIPLPSTDPHRKGGRKRGVHGAWRCALLALAWPVNTIVKINITVYINAANNINIAVKSIDGYEESCKGRPTLLTLPILACVPTSCVCLLPVPEV